MSDEIQNPPMALTRGAAEIVADTRRVQEVMEAVFRPDVHYGRVAGCGPKPMLFKPGAEKIASTFKLAIEPIVTDLSTADEVRVRVEARATNWVTGVYVGSGIGECSSNEEKYKWRKAVCPEEWDATPADRRRIKWKSFKGKTEQVQQVRTEPADVANTVVKIGKKRALVDCVLTVTAASDCFGQDLEDLPPEVAQELAENENQDAPARAPIKPPQRKSAKPAAPPANATTVEGLVENVQAKPFTKKSGDPGIRYGITVNGETYGTFSETDATTAQDAQENGQSVRLAWVQNGKYRNVASITVLGDAAEAGLDLNEDGLGYGDAGEPQPGDVQF